MDFSPIFGTGLARSGGGLYSMCLSTHPEISIACCPNLELFRSFRNAVFRNTGNPDLLSACPVEAPLQDWYGNEQRIMLLDYLIHEASLELPFDEREWSSFLEKSIRRGELEVADLALHYDSLRGSSYKDIFTNLLSLIAEKRANNKSKWIGLHEVWILDFFPSLARAFPDARFLVMFRDPRATINSMMGVKTIDPSQVAQIISYIRHWRKYVALAIKFSEDPLFTGRLHITSHDLVLTQTEDTLKSICRAFELDFDEKMLDSDNFFDHATGAIWQGNSSFETETRGISAHRALRWRKQLDLKTLSVIEYLCGPDLRLLGYPTFTDFADPIKSASGELIEFLIQDLNSKVNWSSDLNDPLLDLGLEAIRRQLLILPRQSEDTALIRRIFLFDEIYALLYNKAEGFLPALSETL